MTHVGLGHVVASPEEMIEILDDLNPTIVVVNVVSALIESDAKTEMIAMTLVR
jgi:molybdopterin/thiamine biosynthesis adenylyltransferase